MSASPAIGWNAARGLAARTLRQSPHPPHRLSTTLAWLPPLLIPTACAPPMPPGISALIRGQIRPQLRRRLIPHHTTLQRTARRLLLPPLSSIFTSTSPPSTSSSPANE